MNRKVKIAFAIIIAVLAIGGGLLAFYFHDNLNYDIALMNKVWDAGFEEKQYSLPNGAVIHYAEGPNNGPALLLIHGQGMSWKDYDTVLPELSTHFHIFAVDVFGQGKSSHDPTLYTIDANGEALVVFAKDVIQRGFYLSGHSSGGIQAAWIAAKEPGMVEALHLEDPPFFCVSPEEVQEGDGTMAWLETYVVSHAFFSEADQTDFTLYSLKNSYFFSLFGGIKNAVVQSAIESREKNPGQPIQIAWIPHDWLRGMHYMDDYDPRFGLAFYDGSWLGALDQEALLSSISAKTIYMKVDTLYGEDGVLYAANTDADADKVERLLQNGERINIKSSHDIHYSNPKEYIDAVLKMLPETQK